MIARSSQGSGPAARSRLTLIKRAKLIDSRLEPGAAMALFVSLACLISLALLPTPAFAQTAPKLPERAIDRGALLPAGVSGRDLRVRAGDNLQQIVNSATPGDTLLLDPGASFPGPLLLPKQSGDGWITIRGGDALAPLGKRVDPSESERMPKIIASGGPAIVAAPGASHYRFADLEVKPRANEFVYALIELGNNSMASAELPHDLIFVHCFVHGDPLVGGRRGFALNSGAAAIVDSHISDFKELGADSQAIAGWSGPGPFFIGNNLIEGAGENLLFGGADAPSADRIPSDIEIRDNFFEKPLSWKAGEENFNGAVWSVKNLLELKDARRVLIENNLLEHNWAQSQNGFAILFTVRNQEGHAPFSVVEDVTFAGNLVRGTGSAINILGRDDSHGGASEQTKRIVVKNNQFEDVGGEKWGGTGTLFQILQGTADVSIEHNTALQSGSIIVAEGPPNTGFVFRKNIVLHNAYGITGTGAGTGTLALTTYFPGAVVEGNVFIGGDPARYPHGNLFAPSVEAVFTDASRRHPRAQYAGAGATKLPELTGGETALNASAAGVR